jgi:hypothetical protein
MMDNPAEIEILLADHPPATDMCPARRRIFLSLDRMLLTPGNTDAGGALDIGGPGRPRPGNPVQTLYESMLEKAILRLKETKVEKGWLITQLYNMGYAIKTRHGTIGFDVTRGPMHHLWKWEIRNDLVEGLADVIDVLCVTHWADDYHAHRPNIWFHTDHFDHGLAKRMLEKGKKVMVPDGLQRHLGDDPRYIYAKHDKYHEFPGFTIFSHGGRHCYQDNPFDTPLLIYKATFCDGKSLLFLGDYDYTLTEDHPLLEGLEIMILHAGGISPEYDETNPCDCGDDDDAMMLGIKRYSPRLVIPGHIMELTHPAGGGRESYGTAMKVAERMRDLGTNTRFLMMFWGESCHHEIGE